MAAYGGAMASGEFAGTKYQNPEPNKKKEDEWTKQSLENQRAEKAENQSAYQGAAKSGEFAGTKTTSPIVSNPTYTNPLGVAAALNRSESKMEPVNPYVVPKSPYQGAAASGEFDAVRSQPKSWSDGYVYNNISTLFGDTYKYPQSPIVNPNAKPDVQPLSPLDAAVWGMQNQPYVTPTKPNTDAIPYGSYGSTAYDPWGTLTDYQYKGLSVQQPQGALKSGMGLYGLGIEKLVADNNKQIQLDERLRQWYRLNPNATEAQYQAVKKSLETSLSGGSPYQGAIASGEYSIPAARPPAILQGSQPPEGAGSFGQSSTQDDLLAAAQAAQKSPYQGAAASGELAGAISTQQQPATPTERPGKGTPIRTYIEGQGWNNGWKLPWQEGGYSETDLINANNFSVGVYDNGKKRFEGYYLAPSGKYYPVNQPKAEYAISRGAANVSPSQFDSSYYMKHFYDGYSSDVDEFIRTFGPEELWRYDPNWKNAGLKYSNPTSWNSGGGSSGGGASGNIGNNQEGRGWYFNPAVSWAT